MSDQAKTILFGLIFVLLMCAASYSAGRVKGREIGHKVGYKEGYESPHPSDTIIVRDTLLIDHPIVVEKEKIRTEYIPLKDTIRITDSLYIPIPIEAKIYKGEDYEAQVSGYHPELDWVRVFPQTTTITQYIERKTSHFGFSVTAGPGVVWNGSLHVGAALVVGFGYRF